MRQTREVPVELWERTQRELVSIPRNTELAWAAGFFEGEGSVYVEQLESGPYLRLNLAQVDDRLPLDRFAAAVGVGKVNGPHLLRGERRRYALDYSKQAHYVMERLVPYLGEDSKKTKAYRAALEQGVVAEKRRPQ